VLRVSYGRTDKATPLLEREKIDYYLPMHRTVKLVNNKKRHVTEPLLTNLIFAHAGQRQMTLLLSDATRENPLSYYYNHFATDAYGKNPPLVVDDESMLNFIRLTSIDDEHIKLVSPQACRYRSGDTVIVTEGKFKGVRGKVARVSGQPGKTQTINFYELGAKIEGEEERRPFYLVDLPGYGYARTGKENRRVWAKFIEEYLLGSEHLKFVCQLVDIRHEPMASDLQMFNWLIENNLPVLIIATKSDKLGKSAAQKQVAAIKRKLGINEISVLPYSSQKNEGRSFLLDVIASSLVE